MKQKERALKPHCKYNIISYNLFVFTRAAQCPRNTLKTLQYSHVDIIAVVHNVHTLIGYKKSRGNINKVLWCSVLFLEHRLQNQKRLLCSNTKLESPSENNLCEEWQPVSKGLSFIHGNKSAT